MLTWFLAVYPFLGWGGSLVILLCSLIAALAYRGREGERYFISNHFVSELGEQGVSRLATLFNVGLILGGFLFLLMMPGVGISLGTVWGYLGISAGIVAAAACMCVGIFPVNNLSTHTIAAMTYFRAGLATVLLFCIAIILQPAGQRVIPLYSLLFGVIAFVAYADFLIYAARVEK